ncbi:hypothetical protein [Nocardia sp. NBC_01009]|uniref:hypothetical protein n=1 Tax=Nocardia sp. NBC_01009 TaxID=2975996 RepID=UPI00386CB500|nr:type IV toxin-antitoxin system AbiEi family antitoxin domain-containing protein [Nocardia sp. NBC_01009]
MVSWREELHRREAAAAEQVEQLRRQIAELTEQLNAEEHHLSRLAITREPMSEICAETAEPTTPEVGEDSAGRAGTVASQPIPDGSPIGLVLVPQRAAGMNASALPEDCGEILAVFAESGGGLRAGQVAAELGIDRVDRSKVESLRGKLKRLVARGWLEQEPSGVFTIAE